MHTLDKASQDELSWKPLRVFNYYRLILATFVLLMAMGGGFHLPQFPAVDLGYQVAAVFYLLVALLGIPFTIQRWLGFTVQVYAAILVDIAVLTALPHFSEGNYTGYGMLMVVSMTATGLLVRRFEIFLFTSMVVFALLVELLYDAFYLHASLTPGSFLRISLIGALVLGMGLTSQAYAGSLRQGRRALHSLEQQLQYVVQTMDDGVLLLNRDMRVQLMNQAAAQLLRVPIAHNVPLVELLPEYADRIQQWMLDAERYWQPLVLSMGHGDRRFTMARSEQDLAWHEVHLLFVEDDGMIQEDAQRLKLISLGRLAAGIAHEVRNPLTAITQAAQLLDEDAGDADSVARLAGMIRTQATRMDGIIHTVQQLSRRDHARPECLNLLHWTKLFIDEYSQSKGIDIEFIQLEVNGEVPSCWVDPRHLHQMMSNLCDNGLRYSQPAASAPLLIIRLASMEHQSLCCIDVQDAGPGIPAAQRSHIFDPFFTTSASGTGLGLYLCSELAACNRGRIRYVPQQDSGACFRIQLPVADNV